MESPTSAESLNPAPMVIEPDSGKHKRTLIVLHGRGSNGEPFGARLLQTSLPKYGSLEEALPDTRFVFPTAARSRAGIYKRSIINQWFNNWSLDQPPKNEELQFPGLKQSSAYIHGLLESEARIVGPENVILWGLSQGCAVSLISLLLWDGPKIAAVIGMCGWLPLRGRIAEASEEPIDDPEDPFAVEGETPLQVSSRLQRAQEYLVDELELERRSRASALTKVSIFLGHGTYDTKVPTRLGKEASELLKSLHFDVSYNEYEGLAHWYSPQMLEDILEFIGSKTTISIPGPRWWDRNRNRFKSSLLSNLWSRAS